MLTAAEKQVLELLRQSLVGKKDSAQITKPIVSSESELTRIITLNDILLTVFPTIEKQPWLRSLNEDLRAQYISNVSQAVQQDYECSRILSALNDEGVDCIPLKGWVLRDLYPKRFYRNMADIDILIRDYNYQHIRYIMEKLGYVSHGSTSWKHDNYSKDNLIIEIHKRLTDDSGIVQKWEKDIWKRATADGHIYTMTKDDFFCFHIVHMYKDFLNGVIGLRRIADTWILLNNSYYSIEAKRKLECFGLSSFVQKMIKLTEVCLDNGRIDSDCELLIKHACMNGISGTDKIHKMGRIASMSKSSLLMGKIKSFFAAVFLPYNRMKTHYPIIIKWPILLPICWLRRILHHVRHTSNLRHQIDYRNVTKQDYIYMKRYFQAGGVKKK